LKSGSLKTRTVALRLSPTERNLSTTKEIRRLEDLEAVEMLQQPRQQDYRRANWIHQQGRREHHRPKQIGQRRRSEHPCLALPCLAWNLRTAAEVDSCRFGMDWGQRMLGLGIGYLDRRYLGPKCLDRMPAGAARGKGKEERARGKGARAREKPRPSARLQEEIERGRSGPAAAAHSIRINADRNKSFLPRGVSVVSSSLVASVFRGGETISLFCTLSLH
jgi:hypothetical protein